MKCGCSKLTEDLDARNIIFENLTIVAAAICSIVFCELNSILGCLKRLLSKTKKMGEKKEEKTQFWST